MKRVLSAGDIACSVRDDNSNDGPFTQQKSRRNKRSKKGNSTADSVAKLTTGAIAVAANGTISVAGDVSQPASTDTVEVADSDCLSQLHKTVDQLSSVVQAQQATINNLTHKLKSIMLFLDIPEDGSVSDDQRYDVASPAISLPSSSSAAADPGLTDSSVQQSSQRQSVVNAAPTYASMAATSRTQATTQPSNFREVVAQAVYVDQRARERRAKSVVVSGLQPSGDVNVCDAVAFQRLCMLELGLDPSVSFTRRLGAATGDRVRPLLVGLRSAEDVAALMTRAKQLRRSTTESVRRNVFINRNMTKVESKIAYEERCRRRRRQLTSNQPTTQRRHDGQRYSRTTDDHGPVHNSPDVATVSQPADVSMSPSAPEFVPAAATARSGGGDAGRHR